jgi:dipeptidyl aminopeptidase/acylaminoacyl peptidase
MLPHEAHGYVARESVETTLAEMLSWLDRWLR